jgi:N-acetyl-anhydromuramyl-L-alanine amidase AmpD
MAYVDRNGLLWSEQGDVLGVEHLMRGSDFGPLKTPDAKPEILVWHLTGHRVPFGANDSKRDGTEGMAKRVAAGSARYYAHGYLGRDGMLFQVLPFTRSAIHVAGRWRGQETNRISNGIEVSNAAYCRTNGKAPGFEVDPEREDYRAHGALLWQMLTEPQNSAILELAEAWQRWTRADVDDCLRGHHDVDPDSSHIDPGPELRAYLDGPVKAHLERTRAEVVE